MDDIVLNKVSIIELKKVVIARLKNENVKIMLLGSRARGNNYPYSDADIGILPSGRFDERKLTLLRETIEIRLIRRCIQNDTISICHSRSV